MPESATRPSHYRRASAGELTPRQQEVIALIAAGRTNPEIADTLGISLDGAKWHVREILARLGVDSREEAAAAWAAWNRPRARFGRAFGALLHAGMPLRFAGIAVVGATGVASAALFVAAVASGGSGSASGDHDTGDEPNPPMTAGTAQALSTATASPAAALPSPVATPFSPGRPPTVESAAGATEFARWAAVVVQARATSLLESMGAPMPGYYMDQRGTIGEPRTFASELERAVRNSSSVLSVGCAATAPACEKFVVAFGAATGPGSYKAFVFEVVDGEVRLRGVYPGGKAPADPGPAGDAANVHTGGVANTPYGPATFTLVR